MGATCTCTCILAIKFMTEIKGSVICSRSEVCSSLFSATKATQQAILLVRALCERSCSSITGVGEKDDAICLLYSNHRTTFTLEEFEEAQFRQAQEAKGKLAKLRMKVLEIVKEACEVLDSVKC